VKIKMKRRKLIELATALDATDGLSGIKFSYAMAKNSSRITSELDDMKSGLKHSKRFKEYEKKRIALCREHADKDENGKVMERPVVGAKRGTMEFVGLESNSAFQTAFDKLMAEYKDELDLREKLHEDYEDALDEEIEFDFYMAKLSDVPKDITKGQLTGIIDLVSNDEDDVADIPKGDGS